MICRMSMPASSIKLAATSPAFLPTAVPYRVGSMEERHASGRRYAIMSDEDPPDKTGNEPAPLLLAAVAIVPLLAVAGWFVFG